MGKEGVGGHTAVVRAPDGEVKTFPLSKKDKGEALFCQVTRDLSIEEKEYFSLCFYDREGIRHWLYNDKLIQKQLKDLPWEFSYEVKFFPTQPTSLTDDNARYNLFQQLKREIVTGRLPASIESHAILGGLQVQADIGDVQQSAEYENYLQTTQFSPYPESGLIGKIREEHIKHKGQTQDEAILGYLDTCRQLSMYGVFLFPAKDDKDNAVNVGICASGINIYREQARLHKFAWQHIIKISFRKSTFSIELKPGQLSKKATTVSYTTPSYYHAKRCWKCGVEHHTFFRLMQPEDKPKSGGLFTLGSTRFHYHGRTQFQTKMASQLFDRPGSATVPRSQAPGTRISQSLDNVAAQQSGAHYEVAGSHQPGVVTTPHTVPFHPHGRKREVKVGELTSDDELVYLPVESPLSAAYYTQEGSASTAVSPASTLGAASGSRGVRFAAELTTTPHRPAESRKRARRNLFGVTWSPSKSKPSPEIPPSSATLLSAHMPASPETVQHLERTDEIPEIAIGTKSAVYNRGYYEKMPKFEGDQSKPLPIHSTRPEDLEKKNEMPGYPIRYFVDVKHSGHGDKYRVSRLKHAGSEDELGAEQIDQANYLFPTIEKSSVGRLEKNADLEPSHIIEHVAIRQMLEKPKAKKRKLGKRGSVESTSSSDSNGSSKERQRLKDESTESRFLRFLRNISPHRSRETATQLTQYHYISTDRYDGPLQSIPKHIELEHAPFRKILHPKTSLTRKSPKKETPVVSKVTTREYQVYGRYSTKDEHENFEEVRETEPGVASTKNITQKLKSKKTEITQSKRLSREEPKRTALIYLKEVPKEEPEGHGPPKPVSSEKEQEKRQTGPRRAFAKIVGGRRSTTTSKDAEEPYPIGSEPYEGPLDSVGRENDLERLPFEAETAAVVAQSPSEAEAETKRTAVIYLQEAPEDESTTTAEEKEKKKRDWGFHLPSFKIGGGSRRPTKEGEEPYAVVSERYEGPLDEVDRENDLEKIPLEAQPAEKESKTTTHRRFFLFGRLRHEGDEDVVEQEHVKPDTYGLASTSYEGPLESLPREDDLDAAPLGEHAAVYHQGDSWLSAKKKTKKATSPASPVPSAEPDEPTKQTTAVVYLQEVPEDESATTAEEKEKKKRDWGFHLPSFKIGGGRRSTTTSKDAEEPYPIVSEPYEGPLDSVGRENDLERLPFEAETTAVVAQSPSEAEAETKRTAVIYLQEAPEDEETYVKEVPRGKRLRIFERLRHRGSEDQGSAEESYHLPDINGSTPCQDLAHENLDHLPLGNIVEGKDNYPPYPSKTQRLRIFSRFTHAGPVEIIEKERIDNERYPKTESLQENADPTRRSEEMDFLELQKSCSAYHAGQYHKLPAVPQFTPTKTAYQPQLSPAVLNSPIQSLEPLSELESRLFNLQEEVTGTEIVEVRIERRCEIELRPVYTLESKKPRPVGGANAGGASSEREPIGVSSIFTTTPPPEEPSSSSMPTGRNFLQRFGLLKNGASKEKKKKSKKGKKGATDTSSSSSSSEDEKAVVVVRQSTITTAGNRPVGEIPPQSLPSTIHRAERLNSRSPRVAHSERTHTVRGASTALPLSLAESGQPHTTVQRWQETNVLPDQVVTEVDDDGNTVTRTIKTSQVKSTVQKQTFQNFTVPEDENMVSTVERVREQIVPRTSPDKSGKVVETHTRTVAYENGSQPAKEEDLGEFVSSQTVTSGNRTVETITYKTEKDGVVETHVEHRVTIHSDDAIDHDAELSKAILEATQMNPDMTVEKIEVKQEATQ